LILLNRGACAVHLLPHRLAEFRKTRGALCGFSPLQDKACNTALHPDQAGSATMHEQQFFEGLQALAIAAFPKRCNNCGRQFATALEFMQQTQSLRMNITGLKQGFDDNNMSIVEAYRNCLCGSTLMDFFSDRRDVSDSGQHRRQLFDKLLPHLREKGMAPAEARGYLLRLLNGQAKPVPFEP
jgi:hypothetical protein